MALLAPKRSRASGPGSTVGAAVVTCIITCLILRRPGGSGRREADTQVTPTGVVSCPDSSASQVQEPWSSAPEDVVLELRLPTWAWCTRPGCKYSRLAEATPTDPNSVRPEYVPSSDYELGAPTLLKVGTLYCPTRGREAHGQGIGDYLPPRLALPLAAHAGPPLPGRGGHVGVRQPLLQ